MKTLKLDPTLFIFLGTSSAQIGWRVKKLLDNAYGDLPIFRYFWMDTDSNIEQNALEWVKSNRVDRSEIGDFNSSLVLQNIDRFPQIKNWWPEDSKLKPGNLGRGAQQIRSVGRLSLFRMFNDSSQDPTGSLYQKLQHSITEICNVDNKQKTTETKNDNLQFIVNQNRARVFIVFSTCGGTGSGTAFDIAYICRNMLNQNNITSTITSVSILPEVIKKAMRGNDLQQENKIRANSYAWFKENDYLIKEQNWNVSYPEEEIEIKNQPFDINFVVDIGNQRGQFLNSEHDLFKMISQSLFLMSSTSLAADADSMKDNMGITNEAFMERLRSYSSFASAALVYPKERIRNYCGSKLAEEILKSVNVAPKQLTTRQIDSGTLISQIGLSHPVFTNNFLLNRRVRNDNLEFIQSAAMPGDALQKITEESMNDQVELEDIFNLIKTDETRLIIEKKAALQNKILELLKIEGPGYVAYILDKLIEDSSQKPPASFVSIRKAITNQGVKQETIAAAQAELENSKKILTDLSGNFPSTVIRAFIPREWKDKFQKAKDACISAMEQVNNLRLRNRAEQSALSIYDALIGEVQSLRSTISNLQETFNQTIDLLKSESNHHLTLPSSESNLFELTQEVVDKKYIEEYYSKNSKDIDRLSMFNLFINQQANLNLNTIKSWDKSSIIEALQETSRWTFASKIENVSILEAMKETYGDKTSDEIKRRLDLLVEYCHPFWRYSADSGLNPLPQGPCFIGVMEADTQLLPEEYRNHAKFQIVSTGLKDAIYLVKILHGVPSFLLTGVSQWQQQYDKSKNGIDPLHIFPGARNADEVIQEKDNRTRNIFAYALAFGYITKRAMHFYYDPEKRYGNPSVRPDKQNKIAEGRANSENVFINHADWVNNIENLVESEIEQMGNVAGTKKIEIYIEDLKTEIDSLPSESLSRDQLKKEIKALELLRNSLNSNR